MATFKRKIKLVEEENEFINSEEYVKSMLSEMIFSNFKRPDFYFHIQCEEGNEMYINKHFVIYYKHSTLGRPNFPREGDFDYSRDHVIMEYDGSEDEYKICSKINNAIIELKKKAG